MIFPAVLVFTACFSIDGDSLRCNGERVRLARIDTPEKHEAGFHEAKEAMQLLVRGKEVTCLVRKREKYGRLLGECSVGDLPLSDYMLNRGYAVPYRGRR